MAGVNKAIILGFLGRDPEIKTMQAGGKLCQLSVATSESWKDKGSGEKREKTEWHRVSIWNERLVEVAEKYLRKGSQVYLEGQIETRQYTDQAGVEKYSTEIVLRQYRGELVLIGGKGGEERANGDGAREPAGRPQGETVSYRRKDTHVPRAESTYDLDDEIPF